MTVACGDEEWRLEAVPWNSEGLQHSQHRNGMMHEAPLPPSGIVVVKSQIGDEPRGGNFLM